jgi:hypothetical protein
LFISVPFFTRSDYFIFELSTPPTLVDQIKNGQVDMDDPATTVVLLKLNAVVGVTAFLDDKGEVRSIGIQCALCIRSSTIPSLPASAAAAEMDGRIAISTLAQLSRFRPTYRPLRKNAWRR